jgi:heme-degrading monooxygenase HmoA
MLTRSPGRRAAVSEPAKTPRPPYYAVIFTSTRTEIDEGYEATAARMVELVQQQPGFLGFESMRSPIDEGGLGSTISYWRDLESIARWKDVAEHRLAQKLGREKWYRAFTLRVAKVEQEWSFERPS